jgi:dipeptidyl-peptidase-4
MTMLRRLGAALIGAGGLMATEDASAQFAAKARRAVDAEAAARQPAPGTVAPGAIAFTHDAKALSFLKAESPDSLSRVLWRIDLPGGEPRVVARPPGGGDTDANVSKEEALRRERQRLRETGITQVVRAEKADVSVIPLSGDIYVQKADGPLVRLTGTKAPEIDPKPNADGSQVAFVREGDLYVIDVESKRETRLTTGATAGLTNGLADYIAQEEMDRFTGFWWSPDGTRIAYEQADERHIPLYTIVHQGSEEFSVETHHYPFAGAANAKVRLGVVPVKGGETCWLEFSGPEDPEVYLARVDWDGPGSLLVQVLDRDQKRLRLLRIDPQSGERTTLIEEKSDTWIDLHHDLRIVEGTGEILWSSERSGFRRLELHVRNGKLIRALTPEGEAIDGLVRLDAKRREVWYAGGGPLESHLYRVSLDGGTATRVTRQRGTHKATVAPDGSSFVDVRSSREQPVEAVLCDRDGATIELIHVAAEDPRLTELELTIPQLLTVRNRDGTPLHGAYFRPGSERLGRPAPLVVFTYGGPTVQLVTDSWGLTVNMTAQYLAAQGFAVWVCDNRGSSRRGRAFQAPIYRRLGVVEVQDQADGVRELGLLKPDEVDTTRVGITGGSYGGYMTLRALELAPEVFHAGVAVAPVTFWEGYDTAYTERYMGTPQENPEGYKESSALDAAYRIAGKLMVVHGMLDENVHYRHTARFATAMIHAAKPFDLLALPDERHSSRRIEDRKYVAERMAAFFEEALKK